MWHTNCGDRTLAGAEARLFAEALWDADYEDEDLKSKGTITVRLKLNTGPVKLLNLDN